MRKIALLLFVTILVLVAANDGQNPIRNLQTTLEKAEDALPSRQICYNFWNCCYKQAQAIQNTWIQKWALRYCSKIQKHLSWCIVGIWIYRPCFHTCQAKCCAATEFWGFKRCFESCWLRCRKVRWLDLYHPYWIWDKLAGCCYIKANTIADSSDRAEGYDYCERQRTQIAIGIKKGTANAQCLSWCCNSYNFDAFKECIRNCNQYTTITIELPKTVEVLPDTDAAGEVVTPDEKAISNGTKGTEGEPLK